MAYYLSKPIVIQAYDPQWPQLYAIEEQQLWEVLSASAVQIEHIGSSSVPDLAAKPIIDISVAVRDLADVSAYVPALADFGYSEVPMNPIFQRRLFCKGPYNDGGPTRRSGPTRRIGTILKPGNRSGSSRSISAFPAGQQLNMPFVL